MWIGKSEDLAMRADQRKVKATLRERRYIMPGSSFSPERPGR